MKPYGVPRNLDVQYPDMADIRLYGFKSCYGHVKGKSGDTVNSQTSDSKRKSRRIWKKKARKEGKDSCDDVS